MTKPKFGDNVKGLVSESAYCPRCDITCYYEPGKPHMRWCDEILVPIADKNKYKLH